jgi:aromatic ring-cleaving dioxygenase
MSSFHVHIYFLSNEIDSAQELFDSARVELSPEFFKLHKHPIGPHPSGMIELHFGDADLGQVRDWIRENRRSHSVLLHKDTGDDFRDHTDNAEWFGSAVSISFDFFKLVQAHPEFRVHPAK